MLKTKQEYWKDILEFFNSNPTLVRDKEEFLCLSNNPSSDKVDETWKVTIEFINYKESK